jgi:L-lactate dehydrogenase complex protein LldF
VSFPLDARARSAVPDAALARHDAAVWQLRARRDAAAAEVPDFEALRERAAAIKDHALDHLDAHLERFEANARAAGAVVHWAADAKALCTAVASILRAHGAARVVKSKSMLTEECGLNASLEAQGFEVVDTDLGERIVQLGHEPPSHLIVPAIHRTRGEIGALFHRHMASPPEETDPDRLMAHARADLRARFLAAEAGITGANFAIAETGAVVLVTNEGNADLGTSLPPLQITCVGIEKVIPTLEDAGVFLRLLARSATGQPISAYTTFQRGPRAGGALHVVLVDNGRSALLANPTHRSALRCIRCGACLNTCPVYRRAGGHAYPGAVAGPIGAVLAPAHAIPGGATLPYASSLCGSCTAVCPVKIDLHEQLLAWRRERPALPASLARVARLAAAVLARPRAYRLAARASRVAWPLLGRVGSGWRSEREVPVHPGESFSARWRRTRGPR